MPSIENFCNKIYNKDCMEILKELPDKSIDLVLTDPPYILENHGGGKTNDFTKRKLVKDVHLKDISDDFNFEEVATEWIRICKKVNLFIFCSNKQISRTMSFFENKGYTVTLLTWDKTNPIPLCNGKYVSNLEFIVCVREKGVFFNNSLPTNKKFKTFRYPSVHGKNRVHKAQKPLELIEDLILLKTREEEVVLDNFSGSGVVAIACKKLNRKFICVEKDKETYKASVEYYKKIIKGVKGE